MAPCLKEIPQKQWYAKCDERKLKHAKAYNPANQTGSPPDGLGLRGEAGAWAMGLPRRRCTRAVVTGVFFSVAAFSRSHSNTPSRIRVPCKHPQYPQFKCVTKGKNQTSNTSILIRQAFDASCLSLYLRKGVTNISVQMQLFTKNRVIWTIVHYE